MDVNFDKAVEACDIEVPQDLVDSEVSLMIAEMNHRLQYEALATGGLPVFTQEEMAERLEKVKEEAFKQIKIRLVLKRIIETEKFEVTRAELEEEAQAISQRQQMPLEMVKDFFGEDLEMLKNDLLVRKAIHFINPQRRNENG